MSWNEKERQNAGRVVDTALGLMAAGLDVAPAEWWGFCSARAEAARSAYNDMVERSWAINGGQAVDMDALRSLAVAEELWTALADSLTGEEALESCLTRLENAEGDAEEGSRLPLCPCAAYVWRAAAGCSPDECVRRSALEWDVLNAAQSEGRWSDALRAAVLAELWEVAAEGRWSDAVERVADAVDDWRRATGADPVCSDGAGVGCASCVACSLISRVDDIPAALGGSAGCSLEGGESDEGDAQ